MAKSSLCTAINVCKDALKHWWRKREDIDDYSKVLRTETPFEVDDVITAVFDLLDKYKSVVNLYYFEEIQTFRFRR